MLLEIFEFLKKRKAFVCTYFTNGTREIQSYIINKVKILINTDLQDKFGRENLTPIEKEYSSTYLAYAFLDFVNLG